MAPAAHRLGGRTRCYCVVVRQARVGVAVHARGHGAVPDGAGLAEHGAVLAVVVAPEALPGCEHRHRVVRSVRHDERLPLGDGGPSGEAQHVAVVGPRAPRHLFLGPRLVVAQRHAGDDAVSQREVPFGLPRVAVGRAGVQPRLVVVGQPGMEEGSAVAVRHVQGVGVYADVDAADLAYRRAVAPEPGDHVLRRISQAVEEGYGALRDAHERREGLAQEDAEAVDEHVVPGRLRLPLGPRGLRDVRPGGVVPEVLAGGCGHRLGLGRG